MIERKSVSVLAEPAFQLTCHAQRLELRGARAAPWGTSETV